MTARHSAYRSTEWACRAGVLEDQAHPLPVGGDGGLGEVVERDDPPVHGLVQREVGRHRREQVAEAVEGAVEPAPGDVVLGLEVAEEGASADPDRRGDLVQGRALEPALGEQAKGGPLDRGVVVATGRPRGRVAGLHGGI